VFPKHSTRKVRRTDVRTPLCAFTMCQQYTLIDSVELSESFLVLQFVSYLNTEVNRLPNYYILHKTKRLGLRLYPISQSNNTTRPLAISKFGGVISGNSGRTIL
jgi:hypothetical protein